LLSYELSKQRKDDNYIFSDVELARVSLKTTKTADSSRKDLKMVETKLLDDLEHYRLIITYNSYGFQCM